MGGTFSEPVAMDPKLGYVGVALRTPNKIRLLHAPNDVIQMTMRAVKEVQEKSGYGYSVEIKDKQGTVGLALYENAFQLGSGKSAATVGKLFTILMMEGMYSLGYDSVVSSDLSREYDQATWFFVKSSCERPKCKVVCLAPGKSDTLIMVQASNSFQEAVRTAISDAWPLGIQREETFQSVGETLTEIKLNGNPWNDYAGAENIQCRQMLIQMIGQLGLKNYRLLMSTNIKGGTDSYFFMHDPDYTPVGICMISLNKNDRFRLLNCSEMVAPIRETLLSHHGEIQREEDKYGSWEFKLKGNPWCCSGDKAIKSRRTISRISETMLEHGWALTNAIDITRSLNDKSVLLYTRTERKTRSFACIALSDIDRIRFLDFTPQHTRKLAAIFQEVYLPGVQDQFQRDNSCYEMNLNGPPWTQNSSYNLHARSALIHVLKEANSLGWRLVASADVSSKYVTQENGPDYPIDVHSWYFVYWPESFDNRTESTEKNEAFLNYNFDEPPPPSYEDATSY